MRRVLTVCAAVLLMMLLSADARGAQPSRGQVPKSVLADTGLSGLMPMSDSEGMTIRGKSVTWDSAGAGHFGTQAAWQTSGAASVHSAAGLHSNGLFGVEHHVGGNGTVHWYGFYESVAVH